MSSKVMLALAALAFAACGGQAEDVCRQSTAAALTVQPRNAPYAAQAACECWEGDGWVPRAAAGCTNLHDTTAGLSR
jgi:hypothetical protein